MVVTVVYGSVKVVVSYVFYESLWLKGSTTFSLQIMEVGYMRKYGVVWKVICTAC